MKSNWKFQAITSWHEVWADEHMRRWQQLADGAANSHVFFQPPMVRAWVETYLPLRDIRPIFIWATTDSIAAFLPLVLWRKNWRNAFLAQIVPVGYSDFDYHDPLFSAIPTAADVADFWSALIEFLHGSFPCDGILLDGITDSLAASDGWTATDICPLLRLDGIGNEEQLMATFKTSLRGDLRRQMRRLEEIGPMEYKEYDRWEDIPPATFAEFMRQHALRWPHAYKAPRFHELLLRHGLPAGLVHFSTLAVGGREIAWHLGFSHQRRYYYYMPAGHQEYLRYSPAKVHLFHLVRRAVAEGYDIFDHLRGEENYKAGWSNDAIHVNSRQDISSSIITQIKLNMLKLRRIITPPDEGNYLIYSELPLRADHLNPYGYDWAA